MFDIAGRIARRFSKKNVRTRQLSDEEKARVGQAVVERLPEAKVVRGVFTPSPSIHGPIFLELVDRLTRHLMMNPPTDRENLWNYTDRVDGKLKNELTSFYVREPGLFRPTLNRMLDRRDTGFEVDSSYRVRVLLMVSVSF